MRTTILIAENRTQLILKPENDHDKAVLTILEQLPSTYRDNFFNCRGGYIRHDGGDEDLVIVFDSKEETKNEAT